MYGLIQSEEYKGFYNPIKQNHTHMKWLSSLIGSNVPMFSIIVFSERCELKKVTVNNPNIYVIKRDRTYATVRNIWDSSPDVISETDVEVLYDKLEKLTHISKEKKKEHVDNIVNRYSKENNSSNQSSVSSKSNTKCPRCGNELVLRTAKKGENAGKQFWGCSAFPKCRYKNQASE